MFPSDLLASVVRLVCGARVVDPGGLAPGPAVFFANHSSHLDFVIIWACLPKVHRARVRPVAGRDYWNQGRLRRWLAERVFNALLIERQQITVANNPLQPMLAALDAGYSLIVFPEGTRSRDGTIQNFKAGLFHLARSRPAIPMLPVFLDNLNRILPRGDFIPVPLIATLHPGQALHLAEGEPRADFLERARRCIIRLSQPASS